MADKTGIEWTDSTWNAVTGCDHVSAGCDHCYAETLSLRLQRMGNAKYANGFAVTLHEKTLTIPLKWRAPKRIFVNSMSDQWHVKVPREFTDRMFAIMAHAPQHTYQILTKRPGRALRYLNSPDTPWRITKALLDYHGSGDLPWPMPNVWIGTSVEDSSVAYRIDALRQCKAAIRFLSCEPLIGPLPNLNLDGINWVIVGGESGQYARPVQADWVRELRDQCERAGVAFFFKQWGGRTPKSGGKILDGREWCDFPAVAS